MQIRTESQNHPLVSSAAVTIDQFEQDTLARTQQFPAKHAHLSNVLASRNP